MSLPSECFKATVADNVAAGSDGCIDVVVVNVDVNVAVKEGPGTDGAIGDVEVDAGSDVSDNAAVRLILMLVLPRRAPEINASAITTSPGPGRILTSGAAVLAWCRPA